MELKESSIKSHYITNHISNHYDIYIYIFIDNHTYGMCLSVMIICITSSATAYVVCGMFEDLDYI